MVSKIGLKFAFFTQKSPFKSLFFYEICKILLSTLIWSCTSQINPQLVRVHQNTERSHLVAIVNNSNYSEAKGHSSFISAKLT